MKYALLICGLLSISWTAYGSRAYIVRGDVLTNTCQRPSAELADQPINGDVSADCFITMYVPAETSILTFAINPKLLSPQPTGEGVEFVLYDGVIQSIYPNSK